MDITVGMIIDDVKVGIVSQGDPNSRLFKNLDRFVKIGCKVIVCVTRSRGATFEAVSYLAGEFRVEWFPKVSISSASQHEAANRSDAQKIVAAVQESHRCIASQSSRFSRKAAYAANFNVQNIMKAS